MDNKDVRYALDFIATYNKMKDKANETEASKLPLLRAELASIIFRAMTELMAIDDEINERIKSLNSKIGELEEHVDYLLTNPMP